MFIVLFIRSPGDFPYCVLLLSLRFSIVTYEGNGTDGATIGHGLGVTPSHVIWKNRDAAVNWINWQTQLADTCVLLNNSIYAISASGNALFTYGDFNSTQLKLNQSKIFFVRKLNHRFF